MKMSWTIKNDKTAWICLEEQKNNKKLKSQNFWFNFLNFWLAKFSIDLFALYDECCCSFKDRFLIKLTV